MRAKQFVFAAAVLFSLGICSLAATDVGYPQAAPRFTIAVPDTWKPVFRGESLMVVPNPEDGLTVQVNQQPSPAQRLLGELTERRAAELQFSDLKLGRASEAENAQAVQCTMMTSTARSAGGDVTLTAVAFTLNGGQHFTIQSAGPAPLAQKHKAVLLGIIDSIKPMPQE